MINVSVYIINFCFYFVNGKLNFTCFSATFLFPLLLFPATLPYGFQMLLHSISEFTYSLYSKSALTIVIYK